MSGEATSLTMHYELLEADVNTSRQELMQAPIATGELAAAARSREHLGESKSTTPSRPRGRWHKRWREYHRNPSQTLVVAVSSVEVFYCYRLERSQVRLRCWSRYVILFIVPRDFGLDSQYSIRIRRLLKCLSHAICSSCEACHGWYDFSPGDSGPGGQNG